LDSKGAAVSRIISVAAVLGAIALGLPMSALAQAETKIALYLITPQNVVLINTFDKYEDCKYASSNSHVEQWLSQASIAIVFACIMVKR
jgi:hypothetical protein